MSVNPSYDYEGTVLEVIDGDTADIDVKLGFLITAHVRFRFYGINTPEIRGAEREEGLRSKQWVIDHCGPGTKVIVRSHKTGKYGRWLGEIFLVDDAGRAIEPSINDQLVELGLAEVY